MSRTVHEDPHPYAGDVVPLLMKDSEVGSEKPAASFRITDWADRVYGEPWRTHRSAGVLVYLLRAEGLGLPITDNNLLHGRVGPLPMLIHTREIDWSRL